MTQAGREGQVLQAVASVVDSLLDDFDVVDLLTQLTEQCSELLDVDSTGLLLANARGQLQLVAATSKRTHDLELFQLYHDEGPCVDTYTSGQGVSAADLRTEADRWPHFVPAAITAGFASVHAVPMRAARTVIGALGLFATTSGALNPADLLVAQTLAHIATVAILQEHAPTADIVAPQLHSALANRVIVEQATGFLRERMDLSGNDAFVLLRRYAHANNHHLTAVARTLMTDPPNRPTVIAGISQLVDGHHDAS